jgi:uncharacterized protein YndB with AHSA1/START domain
MADPSSKLILNMMRIIPAVPSVIFSLLTEPSKLAEWWGPRGFTTTSIDTDLRVGGRYRFGMQPPDGDLFHLTGEFREVNCPSRLAYTFIWEPPHPDDQETVVVLSLRRVESSTALELTHGVFTNSARLALHEQGWTESFERLHEVVSKL